MPGPLLTGKHLLAVYVEGRACPAPTVLPKSHKFCKKFKISRAKWRKTP